MKKRLILLATLMCFVQAEEVKLTPKQEKNWDIKVAEPARADSYPLGRIIVEVVTPPTLLHTISLPFEANVHKLYVAKYQKVKQGEILAEVTGTKWIVVQQKAIADAIEYRHHKHLTERKIMLCKEGIIPKKECKAARAELETDKIKIAAAKALLESYGADRESIKALFKSLKIARTLKVKSDVSGSIIVLNATPGKSTSPSDALFVIKQKGSLWIEANIEALRTLKLKEGERVRLSVADKMFESRVLQLSDVINRENQTRRVRFSVPESVQLASGLILSADLIVFGDVLKLKKSAVIKEGGTQIVFMRTQFGFRAIPVEVMAEDDTFYYIKPSALLKGEVAVNSLAILKNLLGGNDE